MKLRLTDYSDNTYPDTASCACTQVSSEFQFTDSDGGVQVTRALRKALVDKTA